MSGLAKMKLPGRPALCAAKQAIRKRRDSRNPLVRLGVSVLYALWKGAQSAFRFCTDANFRSILLLRLTKGEKIHQTTPTTGMDRYPAIFSACRDYFADRPDLKILSFGCSTGEEVLTLRKYFPQAHITGAEVNRRSLAACRRLPVDERVRFVFSSPKQISENGPYDAIFCMAVFQRTPQLVTAKGMESLQKIYPFERFERQITELDGFLNPQGLLVIHYSQYSLEDTAVSFQYKALGQYGQEDYKASVFDRKSHLVKNASPRNSIFIKQGQDT